MTKSLWIASLALTLPLWLAAPSAAQGWVLDDSLRTFSQDQKDKLVSEVQKAPEKALKDLLNAEVQYLESLHKEELEEFAKVAWSRVQAGREEGYLWRAIKAQLKAANAYSQELLVKVWREEKARLAGMPEDFVYTTVDYALRAALVDRIKAIRNARLEAFRTTTSAGDAQPGDFPLAYANERAAWRETKHDEADIASSIPLPKVRFFSKKAQLEETLLRKTYTTKVGNLTVTGAEVVGLAEAEAGRVSYTDAFGRKVEGLGVSFTAKARLTGVRGDVRSVDFNSAIGEALKLQAHLNAMASIASRVDAELGAVVTEKGAGVHTELRAGAGAEARAQLPITIDLKVFKIRVIPYVSAHAGASADAHATLEVEWSGKLRMDVGASFSTGAGVGAGLIVEIELGETLKRALDKLVTQVGKLVRPIGDFFMGRDWKGPAGSSGKLELTLDDLERVWANEGRPQRGPLRNDADIAARYAPVIYQEVDRGRMDYLRRIDFDGNWNALDNFNAVQAGRGDDKAWVYYEIKETESHFFVTYVLYHAGKQSNSWVKFIRKLRTHENDLGGITVVASKTAPVGREVEAVFVADGEMMRVYENMPKKRDGERVRWSTNEGLWHGPVRFVDEVDHPLVDLQRTHPQIWVDSKEHDPYGYTGRDDRDAFEGDDGIVYAPTGSAEVPKDTKGTPVGYGLRPLSEVYGHLSAEDFATQDDRVSEGPKLPANMRGDDGLDDRARFPWAWRYYVHEETRQNRSDDSHRTQWVEEGELFRDPVKTLGTLFVLPDSFSRRYTRNDFLSPERGHHKGLIDALEGR